MKKKRTCPIGSTMGQAMEKVACSRATISDSYFIMCEVNSQSDSQCNVLLKCMGGTA